MDLYNKKSNKLQTTENSKKLKIKKKGLADCYIQRTFE